MKRYVVIFILVNNTIKPFNEFFLYIFLFNLLSFSLLPFHLSPFAPCISLLLPFVLFSLFLPPSTQTFSFIFNLPATTHLP